MGLEDFELPDSPEGAESGGNSAEASEKYKESAKKAAAGIKRTQKDEKKAKVYDLMLARFLVELILKKKYDDVLERLFVCLDAGYGTNFLLGIVSLIYFPISQEIRKVAQEPEIDFHYDISPEPLEFHPDKLPQEVRLRVNSWIEDMELVSRFDASAIITHRTLTLLSTDETITQFTASVFEFFFGQINIHISKNMAQSYSSFILEELQKKLEQGFEKIAGEESWEPGEI